MTEQENRRVRRRAGAALSVGLALTLLAAAGCGWLWYALNGLPGFLRKENPSLLPQSAAEHLESSTLLRTGDGFYYELEEGSGLGTLLRSEDWSSIPAFSAGEPELSLRFGEQYELFLWADGRAAFYDGYAPGDTQEWAYYILPSGVVVELLQILSERAVHTADPYASFSQ